MRIGRLVVGVVAVLAAAMAATTTTSAQPATAPAVGLERVVVPAQADQDAALKRVKEVFTDDYKKKSAADRAALAARLLEESSAPGQDPATRYAMQREARDIAASAGDITGAVSAIDAMAETFDVDAAALKLDVLTPAARKPGDPMQAATVAAALEELAESALERFEFEQAGKLVTLAEPVARKAKNPDLVARLARRKKEFREAETQHAAVRPMLDQLAKNPEDPAANLAVGKFQCFAMGDWIAGLPMLAKSDDAALKKLAQADASCGGMPVAQAAMGDAWFDFSEKQPTGSVKTRARGRAAYWYKLAVSGYAGLAGVPKARVEKQLAALGPDAPLLGGGERATDGWYLANDPSNKAVRTVQSVAKQLPDRVRPRPNVWFKEEPADEWMTQQARGSKIEGVFKVAEATPVKSGGRDAVAIQLQPVGPANDRGVQYLLVPVLPSLPLDEKAQRVTAGGLANVRGTVRRMYIDHWNGRGDGREGGITSITIAAELDNPSISAVSTTIQTPKMTYATLGPEAGGPKLLETLVAKIPEDLITPAPKESWEGGRLSDWLREHTRGVKVDAVVQMRAGEDAPQRLRLYGHLGPITRGGTEFLMNVSITASNAAESDQLRKYNGAWVRFRGVGTQVGFSQRNLDRGTGAIKRIYLSVGVPNPTITPVPPPAGAAP